MTETVAAARLRTLIERIERLEEERKSIADDIAGVYKELMGEGFDKDAAKVVLKIRRNADALAVWNERSELVDLYLVSLGMVPERIAHRAPARTREIIEEFDAETGEIHGSAVGVPGAVTESAAHSADESDAPVPHSSHETPSHVAAIAGETVSPSVSPAPLQDEDVPAFLKKDYPPLRPHCLNPNLCAGSGSKHCYSCLKALDEALPAPSHQFTMVSA